MIVMIGKFKSISEWSEFTLIEYMQQIQIDGIRYSNSS